jgi:5-amino-6-(5-phosphoribosylamino)uracil reductase
MTDRPYVVLSCAISLDGFLDTAGRGRLVLSNAADLERVDRLRADCDAVLVGASTVRRDDPRLLVRDEGRRMLRRAAGRSSSPVKVTVTASGDLPADAAFFRAGDAERLVYCPDRRARRLRERIDATVVGSGTRPEMARVLDDLGGRGIRRLLVEGGGGILTQFLAEDLADELQLVIAPLFVGERHAPRFVGTARFPWTAAHRARLVDTRSIGDVVLLRYALSDRFDDGVVNPSAAAALAVDG